jgi:uncharacterized membrane protein YhaH (DUF805 family)
MPLSQLLWSFDGRIARGQYWKGVVVLLAAIFLFAALGGLISWAAGVGREDDMRVLGAVFALPLAMALFVGNLALDVKRFHDRGKSGWWVLITLVPLIGPLWLLLELGFLEGDLGPNAYGPNPLAAPA